jgi:hypothetical protein
MQNIHTGQYIRTCNSLNELVQIVEERSKCNLELGISKKPARSEFFNNFVVIATPKVAA